ncbi:hypothetical protein ACFO0N_15085 [Halobium salinum]|uniref:Uncharacterized protein n=1 Tax=Halobium salinum TaxID=1364940 RepID=A0ABD5PFI3_9EURY|nr:hypothetical protein [Halobium salinum]
MKRETTLSGRGLISLIVGFFLTMIIDWGALEPIGISGVMRLYTLGGTYLAIVTIVYIVISFTEPIAIKKGLPVSTTINVVYEVATAAIFWTIGVFIGVGVIDYLFPQSNYLVEGAAVVGLFAVILGEYTLWRGRIGRNRTASP